MTTSKHSLRAHVFVSHESKMLASIAFFTSPSDTSMPNALDSTDFAYKSASTFSAFRPAFSESVRGITSKEAPNFSTAYWSRPGCSLANFWIC